MNHFISKQTSTKKSLRVNLFTKLMGLVTYSYLLIGCNSISGDTDFGANSDTAIVKRLVQDWNKAHMLKDVGVFSNLYDDLILYYGVQQSKNYSIEKKLSFFKKYPDFYQQIFGDIQIDNISNVEVKCSFVKRVTVNQDTKDYPSYLIFKKNGDHWKIVSEGDLVTDKNLAENKRKIPANAVKGDFNGDGKLDYMWLIPPKINTDTEVQDCFGNCNSYIKFSDSSIPSIKIENCISGMPINHGDLNNNGTDEIGLLPGWFNSCWTDYYVWTFINAEWTNAVEPFPTHCNQWDDGIKPIEIDYNKEGFVIIRYSEFSDESDKWTKSKSVRIAK
jgi:ketosteroid isomerase-like protein